MWRRRVPSRDRSTLNLKRVKSLQRWNLYYRRVALCSSRVVSTAEGGVLTRALFPIILSVQAPVTFMKAVFTMCKVCRLGNERRNRSRSWTFEQDIFRSLALGVRRTRLSSLPSLARRRSL